MAQVEIQRCDLCQKEYRSDVVRHWSYTIAPIHLNMKSHAGLQCEWKLDICTDCGVVLRDGIVEIIEKLKSSKKGD